MEIVGKTISSSTLTTDMFEDDGNELLKRQAWDDSFYLQVYLQRAQGYPMDEIRKTIGCSKKQWEDWMRIKPALKEAFDKGSTAKREVKQVVHDKDRPQEFSEYVYGHMSPEVKKLWDQIEGLGNDTGEIKELLADSGTKFRQGLFVYALTESRFNMTEAMQKAYVNLATYKEWLEDPVFKQMVEEISFHRKNFFENALMSQVAMGETAAVIFANKSQNKDRGYGDQLEVNHTGTVNHQSVSLNLEAIGLPLESQRLILEALKDNQRKLQAQELENDYIDAPEIMKLEKH